MAALDDFYFSFKLLLTCMAVLPFLLEAFSIRIFAWLISESDGAGLLQKLQKSQISLSSLINEVSEEPEFSFGLKALDLLRRSFTESI